MAFKITGTMQVVQVAKSLSDLEGFKLAASKSGVDLGAAAQSKGLSLEASNDKVLFFRAKMLGYDLPNGNGDSIPRIYAANFGPSFIGKHLDVNHETDPSNIIGKVLATFHVEVPINASEGEERIIGKNVIADMAEDSTTHELQLEGICMIDRTTALGDDIAKKLISGVLNSVSQEASTEYAECSVCAHRINNPLEALCAHMNSGSLMVQSYQVEGRKHKVLAYKVHHNPIGTGLGVVTVPAYDKAKVSDITAEQTLEAETEEQKKRREKRELDEGGKVQAVPEAPDTAKELIDMNTPTHPEVQHIKSELTSEVVKEEKIDAALNPNEINVGDVVRDDKKMEWGIDKIESDHRLVRVTTEKWVNFDELSDWTKTGEKLLSSSIQLLSLSKNYSDVHAELAKVLNAATESNLSVSAGIVSGDTSPIMAVAKSASAAGIAYRTLVANFWKLAGELDSSVSAVLFAKEQSKTEEEIKSLVSNLSSEAKALGPDTLTPISAVSAISDPEKFIEGLRKILALRQFVIKSGPLSKHTDYTSHVTELSASLENLGSLETSSAEDKAKFVSVAQEKLKALLETESKLANVSAAETFSPCVIRTGFIVNSVMFDKSGTEELAKTLLAYILPETAQPKENKILSFFVPGEDGGYELTVDAAGKKDRKGLDRAKKDSTVSIVVHEYLQKQGQKGGKKQTSSQRRAAAQNLRKARQAVKSDLDSQVRQLSIQSAPLQNMSPDQINLLLKKWEEARERTPKDPEALNIINDEISRIKDYLTKVTASDVEAKAPYTAPAPKKPIPYKSGDKFFRRERLYWSPKSGASKTSPEAEVKDLTKPGAKKTKIAGPKKVMAAEKAKIADHYTPVEKEKIHKIVRDLATKPGVATYETPAPEKKVEAKTIEAAGWVGDLVSLLKDMAPAFGLGAVGLYTALKEAAQTSKEEFLKKIWDATQHIGNAEDFGTVYKALSEVKKRDAESIAEALEKVIPQLKTEMGRKQAERIQIQTPEGEVVRKAKLPESEKISGIKMNVMLGSSTDEERFDNIYNLRSFIENENPDLLANQDEIDAEVLASLRGFNAEQILSLYSLRGYATLPEESKNKVVDGVVAFFRVEEK